MRFAEFEVTPAGELRRNGAPLHLQPQPMKVLALLVARAGELVTREELRRHVWGDETFVEFDQSLNWCIRRIREVLGLVRFHETYEGHGDVIPVSIEGGKPYVAATLKMPGKPALARRYLVDTGSGGALADELFVPDGEPIGPDLGRAEYVELGPFRFAGANGTSGAMKIGGELWKRFTVVADFARSRLLLEPNRHYGDALLFDTSGLELEQTESGLRIARVYPRTPGEEAGLRAGDVIERIDRQPALRLGLDRVRRMFHQVRTHELTLAGGRAATLALRPLLPAVGATVVPTQSANGMPVFEVRVQGKALTFLIDTGSSYTFLDSAAAQRLGIAAERFAAVRGAGGGEVRTGIVNSLTFDVHGLRSTQEVRLTDLSGLEAHFGRRIDGFFGYPLLAQQVVTFAPGKVVFGEYDNRGTVLPIEFRNRWIYVPATIKVAGRKPVTAQFFVDSGSLDGANHPILRRSTAPRRRIPTGRGLGGGGGEGVSGRAEWVRLGPYRADDVPSSCCGPLPGTEAMLGQDVLGRFVITYDYARRRMTVMPVTSGRN